jgi:hypothetical protein
MTIDAKNNGKKTRVLGYTVAVEMTNQELIQVSGGIAIERCADGTSDTWSSKSNQTYADDCK